MNYQQIYPIKPLRKYIRYFWTLEDDSLEFSDKTFKIMSDGLPGLIFQENQKSFLNKDNQELPQLFLYGQTTRYTELKAVKNFRNIGVYFQPNALRSIFGIDAVELTNQHIDINELFKTNVTDQLLNTTNAEQRIKLVSSFLIEQAEQRETENGIVNFAIAQLQKGVSLPTIQTDLNISERSLQRYFKQYIGVSPKLYARINRFQSALENIRQTRSNKLTDIAYQSDYFDQSHFIRDFKEFAGTSPKHFKLKAIEQVANFPEWKI
jgi:AraC-like DNA-binding protein